MPKPNYYSPYEIQIVVNSVSTQGITVLISTTSATQIHSLFISYVAYDPTILNLKARNIVYDKYVGVSTWSEANDFASKMTDKMFCGFSGFIIGNRGGPFSLSVSKDSMNNAVQVLSSQKFYYVSVSEFVLTGGECGQCAGYSIYHDGSCVASCPPGSYFNGDKCISCSAGQVWDGSKCVTKPVDPVDPTNPVDPNPVDPNRPAPSCPVGTHWDQQQLRCLPCAPGCYSCPDCYSCDSCKPGFYRKSNSPLCDEVCGDGKRFILPCDDGNNQNGDGCSSSCEIEEGYNCQGGSDKSRDSCSRGHPSAISFSTSGQSHLWGRMVINVRINYLPKALMESATDCHYKCNNVLSAKIIDGDKSAISIKSSYIPNTRFSFSIEVIYGR